MILTRSKKLIGTMIIIFGCGILLAIGWTVFGRSEENQIKTPSSNIRVVEINNVPIKVDLAITGEEQRVGLSGRESLADDRGMLFIFSTSQRRSFWMKQMNFPIDMIWINEQRVVDLTENVPIPIEGENLPTYRPELPADTVLEVPAGFSRAHNIEPGAEIRYFCTTNTGIDGPAVAC